MGMKIKVHEGWGPGISNPSHPAFYDPDYYTEEPGYAYDEAECQERIDSDGAAIIAAMKDKGFGDVEVSGFSKFDESTDKVEYTMEITHAFDHLPSQDEVDAFIDAVADSYPASAEVPWDDGETQVVAVYKNNVATALNDYYWSGPKKGQVPELPKDVKEYLISDIWYAKVDTSAEG